MAFCSWKTDCLIHIVEQVNHHHRRRRHHHHQLLTQAIWRQCPRSFVKSIASLSVSPSDARLCPYLYDLWGHPFMTSTKKFPFLTPSPCPHGSTWAGPPSTMWTSTRGRHEIHTALLKRL